MTLDEAIEHFDEISDMVEKQNNGEITLYRQLTAWLLELRIYQRGIKQIKELQDGFNQIPLSLEANVLKSALELLGAEGEPQKNEGDDTMTKDQLANFIESTKGKWTFQTESGRVIKGEEIEKQIIESLRNSKPKAKWEMIGIFGLAYKCSRCKENSVKNSNYCPNCGAKMEGAE